MSYEEPGRAGTRVGGRYVLSELLGRGGMAEVRKGTDVRLGRVVAVKRLRTDLAGDPTFQARFRREAQSSASLNHPAIVSVYDTGEELATDGSGIAQPYIVMEYVAGRTLRDILREGRKILPGRPPFVGDSPVAVAYQHVREPAVPPSDHDTSLTPEIDAIVMKALAKRVEDRYQSAAAMRADIERYLAGHPVRATAPLPPEAPTTVAPTYQPPNSH